MEQILRSEEMAEITLLPVRHHSPACSLHIRSFIEAYHPDVILIEGPDNANALVPVMVHEETKAPFAIYYSYFDTEGKVTKEKEHYRCYYPFLDYSPELTALRTGHKLGINTCFIDLTYGEILLSQAEGKGLRKTDEKQNYNDDYLLTENRYLKTLCEKAGLRSFDEFWEKYFEIEGMEMEDETWFSNLLIYCAQARDNTPDEALEAEGCLARENRMAWHIVNHARELGTKPDGKVLVVTGGFHTVGLKTMLEKAMADKGQLSLVEGDKRKGAEPLLKNQGVYLMPYSMEAADALNGYASGMPFSGFYQSVWEKLAAIQAEANREVYEKTVLDYLVQIGKETRKKEGCLSTYDEICALQMADGLAALRGKASPGAYELSDAVLSSYVKGEYNISTDAPMRILRKKLTGDQMGQLWSGAEVPPIILDFRRQVKEFGLKAGSTLETEVVLSIFSTGRHREISKFFYRMSFLNSGYAVKKKGPGLAARTDLNLMRETWGYRWNVRVDAALIDVSVHGATIHEAITSLVGAELQKELTAGTAAELLVKVFEMGLEDRENEMYDRVNDLIHRDTDFFSLADALKALMLMQEMGKLYRVKESFDVLLVSLVRKLILLLPSMAAIKDENLKDCMNALKMLYQITGRFTDDREPFFDALLRMQKDSGIQPGLNGCVHGMMYSGGQESMEELEQACRGYLGGTEKQLMNTARFFHGLFFSARDVVFTNHRFLDMLDSFFGQVQNTEFMELLPELRMAFAYFTPREIDKVAAYAADLHGIKKEDLRKQAEILPDWYAYGKELDSYAVEIMSPKGEC